MVFFMFGGRIKGGGSFSNSCILYAIIHKPSWTTSDNLLTRQVIEIGVGFYWSLYGCSGGR